VVDPETETVAIHHAERPVQSLTSVDVLRFPDLLGDFELPVTKIFEKPVSAVFARARHGVASATRD
jgi:hypothetical protein